MQELYWDCAAAMPPDRETLDFYRRMMEEHFANQEAIHLLAYRERQVLEQAERELAKLVTGRAADRVVWGGSATEIFRLIAASPVFKSAVFSTLEHPAVHANFKHLAPEIWQAGTDGKIIAAPEAETAELACFHQVQSELGVIQDLSGLFNALPGACRMVDAVQAAGKMAVQDADITVISGVKFGSPGGAAAILRHDGKFTEALWKHIRILRSEKYAVGRISVPLVLTMVYALQRAVDVQNERFGNLDALRQEIIAGCRRWDIVPVLPDNVPVSPYILSLLLPVQQSAIVVRALSEKGVFTASGSACSAESDEPSAAMLAIRRSRNEAYRALRLSFRGNESGKDVKFFLSALETVLKNY